MLILGIIVAVSSAVVSEGEVAGVVGRGDDTTAAAAGATIANAGVEVDTGVAAIL